MAWTVVRQRHGCCGEVRAPGNLLSPSTGRAPTRGATERAALSPRQCPVPIPRAVGRGLAAVHAAGLIHRDVKPANVMVGDDGRVRLMDFGLAASVVDDAITLDGSVGDGPGSSGSGEAFSHPRGTLPYMAPEQHRSRALDARADQFSLCVTMHEAPYGEHPFEGDSPLEIAAAIVEGRLRPLPTDVAVPARIGRVLRQGLAAVPEDRWPDVEALLWAIERAAAWPRRRRWIAGLSLGAVVVAGTVAAAVEWEPASDPCEGVERSIAESWGPARRAEARARLRPPVLRSWRRVGREWTTRWRAIARSGPRPGCRPAWTGTAGEDVADRGVPRAAILRSGLLLVLCLATTTGCARLRLEPPTFGSVDLYTGETNLRGEALVGSDPEVSISWYARGRLATKPHLPTAR